MRWEFRLVYCPTERSIQWTTVRRHRLRYESTSRNRLVDKRFRKASYLRQPGFYYESSPHYLSLFIPRLISPLYFLPDLSRPQYLLIVRVDFTFTPVFVFITQSPGEDTNCDISELSDNCADHCADRCVDRCTDHCTDHCADHCADHCGQSVVRAAKQRSEEASATGSVASNNYIDWDHIDFLLADEPVTPSSTPRQTQLGNFTYA